MILTIVRGFGDPAQSNQIKHVNNKKSLVKSMPENQVIKINIYQNCGRTIHNKLE